MILHNNVVKALFFSGRSAVLETGCPGHQLVFSQRLNSGAAALAVAEAIVKRIQDAGHYHSFGI
ncbi:hypothetical protein CPT06_15670 [Bacillus vallismortis]|nr:hypothetical protein CPT06_15670 [Bacillus vallismortis]